MTTDTSLPYCEEIAEPGENKKTHSIRDNLNSLANDVNKYLSKLVSKM